MKYLYFFILFLFSTQSLAVDNSSVSELNTFFTTPELRSKLNKLRNSGHFDTVSHTSSVATPSPDIKLQGLIYQNSKMPIAIINDHITTHKRSKNNRNYIHSADTDSLNVTVKTINRSILLKPGQFWSSQANKSSENYSLPDSSTSTANTSSQLNIRNED